MASKLQNDLLDLLDQMFNLTEKEHEQILLEYKKSRDNIKQFIAELFMKYGHDGKLDMTEFQKYNRMQRVQEFFKEETKQLGTTEITLLTTLLAKVYKQSYYKTAYTLDNVLSVRVDFKKVNPKIIKEAVHYNWSGVPFSQRIWANRNALINTLRSELTTGIRDGDSLDKIARRIDKAFNTRAYQSQRLMRTESARVINSAQEKIYKDSGIVKEVEWTATLDNKTDSECRKLDGKRFRLDNSSKPSMPKHPNCRCAWIPVPYADYKPKKRKDNESKEVIKYQNYNDWYNHRVK